MDEEPQKDERRMGEGIAVGIAIGLALGVAMDNIAVGIAIGVAIGAAIGSAWKRKPKGGGDSSQDQESEED